MKKKIVSCFDIGEVPRSPGKWNWNWLYFLPFIFTFEQGEQSVDIKALLSQEAKRSYDKLFTQMKAFQAQKRESETTGTGY